MKYHQFDYRMAPSVEVRGSNIEIGPFTVIEDYTLLDCGKKLSSYISIGSRCKLKRGAVIRTYDGFIDIGNRVSVGEYSVLAGHGGLKIGNNSIIAAHVYISAANHIHNPGEVVRFQGETANGITIGNECWIGGFVMIVDGVIIEDGVVVGAGSVVTRNLPKNTVCYGVPCRPIKQRRSKFADFGGVFDE